MAAHQHWARHDEAIERAAWEKMQILVRAGVAPETGRDAKPLLEQASERGYADAEAQIAAVGLEPEPGEDPYRAAVRETFEDYGNGEYFRAIEASVRMLEGQIAPGDPTDAIKKGIAAVAEAQREAYAAGRDRRLEQASSNAPP